jgi:anti-sigma B factor antagonist
MSAADVRFTRGANTVLAHLSGDIDMSSAGDLSSAVATAATNDVIGVVLDLTDVDYLDSAGIHLIFRLREALLARGQQLRLVIPDRSPVNDVLRLAGITALVGVAAEPAHALRALERE